MEYKQIKRIFFNWLKSKGAYEAYKLARHNTNHLKDNPYYRCNLVPVQFVNHAFTWRETHEGHNFWDQINYEWRQYLQKIRVDTKYQ